MPFFQGAYDFDISGPVQMNEGNSTGYFSIPAQGWGPQQYAQPQQTQGNTPPQPSNPPPPVSPPPPATNIHNATPMLAPVQAVAQPPYQLPSNTQYVLYYAPAPNQGGYAPVSAQGGYMAQPAASGGQYYLVPQPGYPASQPNFPPSNLPHGFDSHPTNASSGPSINPEMQQANTNMAFHSMSNTTSPSIGGFHVPNGHAPAAASHPISMTNPTAMDGFHPSNNNTSGAPSPNNTFTSHSFSMPVPGAQQHGMLASSSGAPNVSSSSGMTSPFGTSLPTPNTTATMPFPSASHATANSGTTSTSHTAAVSALSYTKYKKQSWFTRLLIRLGLKKKKKTR